MSPTVNEAVIAASTHNEHWDGGPWFLVFPLFWITVFVVLGVLFWRRRGQCGPHGRGGAEAVLRERYARGEVSESEYNERLEVLRRK